MIPTLIQFQKLRKNLRLSYDELKHLQDRKLRAVVRHAYQNVPYYRSLFDSVGLSPEEIRTIDDLKLIPMTTKEGQRALGRIAAST